MLFALYRVDSEEEKQQKKRCLAGLVPIIFAPILQWVLSLGSQGWILTWWRWSFQNQYTVIVAGLHFFSFVSAAAAAKLLQSCPAPCDPMDGSPPGSLNPGILQARTVEWVAISFSNAWKWRRSVMFDSQRPHICLCFPINKSSVFQNILQNA